MDITLEELSYTYQPGTPFAQRALQEVTLSLSHGTICAVVGKTGSGKSTLIQLIAGLLRPTSGSIQVGKHRVTKSTKKIPFRSQVGIVFQYPEHQLFAETVYKDIAYGPTNQGLAPEIVRDRVLSAIQIVGLSESLLERSPFSLSGGQMRRVALAGVLSMEPSILILDEPTVGLDKRGKEQLLGLIRDLHQVKKCTIILVTHQMEEVAQLADEVVVMEAGFCRFNGTAGELFQDQARLESFGLELPAITKFIIRLNERLSPPIPTSIFQLSELITHLEQRRQGVEQ